MEDSLCFDVERVIGRMKKFTILKGALSISMARLCVCAWLRSFQPALVLQPDTASNSLDEHIDSYFECWMNPIMMETMKKVKMRTTRTLMVYLQTTVDWGIFAVKNFSPLQWEVKIKYMKIFLW